MQVQVVVEVACGVPAFKTPKIQQWSHTSILTVRPTENCKFTIGHD